MEGTYAGKPYRKVAAQRALQRMTQAELAEKAGLSVSTVVCIEIGTKSPSLESMVKIAQALGCTVDELI